MSLSVQSDFIANLNRMFDNHLINKGCVDEAEREFQRDKFISRAITLRDNGVGDITEQSKITGSFLREFFTGVFYGSFLVFLLQALLLLTMNGLKL